MKINETVFRGRPKQPRTPVEEAIYDKLDELNINYLRVDHEHADTMEDCREVERVLGTKICKNLLLTDVAIRAAKPLTGGTSVLEAGGASLLSVCEKLF